MYGPSRALSCLGGRCACIGGAWCVFECDEGAGMHLFHPGISHCVYSQPAVLSFSGSRGSLSYEDLQVLQGVCVPHYSTLNPGPSDGTHNESPPPLNQLVSPTHHALAPPTYRRTASRPSSWRPRSATWARSASWRAATTSRLRPPCWRSCRPPRSRCPGSCHPTCR